MKENSKSFVGSLKDAANQQKADQNRARIKQLAEDKGETEAKEKAKIEKEQSGRRFLTILTPTAESVISALNGLSRTAHAEMWSGFKIHKDSKKENETNQFMLEISWKTNIHLSQNNMDGEFHYEKTGHLTIMVRSYKEPNEICVNFDNGTDAKYPLVTIKQAGGEKASIYDTNFEELLQAAILEFFRNNQLIAGIS